MKTLGFIIRQSKKFTDINVIKTLYFTYVRCQLEYASQIWNPQYSVYVSQIERVQNKFLKYLNFICRKKFESYNAACAYHKIMPLNVRRELADQVFLFKIINNYFRCQDLINNIYYLVPTRCNLRYKRLFSHDEITTKNYIRNGYLYRALSLYNKKYTDLDIFHLSLTQYIKQV